MKVKWLGPVSRTCVENLLWASDLMVLLTAGENFGHVVAESLQAGCPVLITDETPWTEFIRAGAGEIVEDRNDFRTVGAALDRWSQLDQTALERYRERATEAFDAWRLRNSGDVLAVTGDWMAKRDKRG